MQVSAINTTRPKRVVVAMSGGVDSSVAAALMKQAGHDVVGITLQLYDHGSATGRKGSCCAGQDVHDARQVAETLGIPHYVLDYERRFAEAVIDSFAESYVAGETPIPCVTCNSEIKFKDLLITARDLGAELMATGHYVQKIDGSHGTVLARAVDPHRDQSYFLFATTREQLSQLVFPIGGLEKARVREIAKSFNLPIADKADSQDICFVPSGRYTDIIERLKPGAIEAGDIVHIDGRVIGRHEGVINYTVGQRKGLKIPGPEPLYVVRLDASRNEVVVGPRSALATRELTLRDVNWLGDGDMVDMLSDGLDIFVRVRSSQPLRPARLFARNSKDVWVVLHDGELGVAVGQACVFYADDSATARILGGGYIARAVKEHDVASRPGKEAPVVVAGRI